MAIRADQLRAELLDLPEAAFYDFSPDLKRDLQERLRGKDFFGLVLGAPAAVDCGRYGRLPLILLSKFTALRTWEVEVDLNALLVASDLTTGVVRANPLQVITKRWKPGTFGSRVGRRPEGDRERLETRKAEVLDAKAIAALPWRTGRHALTLITHDWVSNTVAVSLTGGPPAPAPERVPLDVARQYPKPERASVDPPAHGLTLIVPEEVAADAPRIEVRGAARVPAPEFALVESGGGDAALPGAVLNAALLVLQLDAPVVARADIRIPLYGVRNAGDVGAGSFSLDLLEYLRTPLEPADYLLYLVAGEAVCGPAPVRIKGPAAAE